MQRQKPNSRQQRPIGKIMRTMAKEIYNVLRSDDEV